MENGLNLFGGLAGIGALAAGIGFAYSQFRSGANQAKDDLIETLRDTALAEKVEKDRLAAEKTNIITSHQTQLNELNNKIGKLQGLYEANEKEKANYLQILQGRNPEQVKFMEYVTTVSGESAKYMKETSEILVELKTFMKELNDRHKEMFLAKKNEKKKLKNKA